MSGPFTTVTVEQYQLMMDIVRIVENAELGHGANCGAISTIEPRPCSCGLDDLDAALNRWNHKDKETK